MKPYETHSHVGPDGALVLRLPAEFINAEVDVTVSQRGNGRAAESEDWHEFVRRTGGSIPDFPDVERPGPESFESREPID